jgi:uroporphyrinogen-III synthase
MEQSFNNRTVLAFESRRATEIGTLIETFGGRPVVAPAMREVPRESDEDAIGLADGIERGDFDAVVFLTGVGVRALLEAADRAGRRARLVEALRLSRVIVRGPKPAAVLRELQVPVWANAPEPNTWRELMEAIEARADEWTLSGARVAVQEYGVSNTELLDALRTAGAQVGEGRPGARRDRIDWSVGVG